MRRFTPCLILALALPILVAEEAAAPSEVVTEVLEYQIGDETYSGFVASDAALKGKRPGVLICHAWKGEGEFVHEQARRLAALGYVALCLDVYGKGVRPETNEEAGKLAGGLKGDRALLRARAAAGLAQLTSRADVDPARVAAIGYCFGGTTALELARSGAAVAGVASFHGGLGSPTPEDARNIKGKVLVLHGADDPFVPAAEVAGFEEEMRAAGVDWQLVKYGGAVHSFTEPAAGDDPKRGAAYNEAASTRSWQAMLDFFTELFAN